ncbi:MAG: tetratricopeptide repeat protein [Treponemataceae bacterium]|nr:tetratricopeptide repeat protein [Treponemataceae bacterium]
MAEDFKEGKRLYDLQNYHDALNYFQKLLSANPESADEEVFYYIGLCFSRLNKPDEAMQYIEQVVTTTKDTQRMQQCRLILAVLYTQTGRLTLADYELKKLLQSGCQTVPVMTALGYAAWAQSRESEAIEWYTKALELDPNNATALNGFGYVLADSNKDLTRALSYCRKALEVTPDSAAYLDSIAWIYYKLGLLKEAKTYIKRAKSRNPKNDEILNHYRAIFEQVAINNSAAKNSVSGGSR